MQKLVTTVRRILAVHRSTRGWREVRTASELLEQLSLPLSMRWPCIIFIVPVCRWSGTMMLK